MLLTVAGRHGAAPPRPPVPPLPVRAGQALDLKSIGKRHWRIVACSAVTGDGLLEGFDYIVKDISSRIYLFDH